MGMTERTERPPMLEKDFQSAVIELAKWQHWRWYHTRDSRRSPSGFSDLIMLRGQRAIAAELKTAAGIVSTEQQQWLDAFALAGIEAYIWRPDDLDTIIPAVLA